MNIKGTVKVQLFDAKTGKLTDERISHNMITNAADLLMNGAPYEIDRRTCGALSTETRETDWSKLYNSIYGGILLFANTIQENANHLYEPLSNYPVGYGSMLGQDTSDNKTLTYNGVESGIIEDQDHNAIGFSYVYDATSSNANGVWDTVCLTSAKGGRGYIEGRVDGSIYDSFFNRGRSDYRTLCGCSEKYMYYISSTYGNDVLYRKALTPFDLSLTGNDLGYSENDLETVFSLPDGDRIFIDSATGKIYELTVSGQTITVVRYNDEDDLTDTTTFSLEMSAGVTIPSYNRQRLDFAVRGNYLYIGNRGATLLKVNLSNAADYDEITVTTGRHDYSSICSCLLPTGDIYRFPDFIDANDDVHTIGAASLGDASYDYMNLINVWAVRGWLNSNGYAGSIFTPFLSTIFNLDDPVTKDASKTAKITYNLTIEDENANVNVGT